MTKTETRYGDGADVGDILECSWGYDQTNIDYYKVMRRTKASAWILPIGQKMVPGSEGFMSERVLPDPDKILGWRVNGSLERDFTPQLKRVRLYDGKACLTMTSFSVAFPWDGEASYQSHYA